VRPMDVSRDLPCWMQQADAPDPRCRIMRLRESAGCALMSGVILIVRLSDKYLL
jgi:hypothetical protein